MNILVVVEGRDGSREAIENETIVLAIVAPRGYGAAAPDMVTYQREDLDAGRLGGRHQEVSEPIATVGGPMPTVPSTKPVKMKNER